MSKKPRDLPPEFGKAFNEYDPNKFTFIPLHKPFKKIKKVNKDGNTVEIEMGKRPLQNDWVKKAYNSKKVRAVCIEEGRNMGLRPTAEQLICDIDPRNNGDESWAKMCSKLGDSFDPNEYPTAITGGGGEHVLMYKPADFKVRDTIDGYPGLEFKSAGRQVLAAGCVHPGTGKLYRFKDGTPSWSVRKAAPRKLLAMIERPPAPVTGAQGGHVAPHRLAKALAGLSVEDFRDHDKWLALMMSCHHATGGEGRYEFIEWSTTDSIFADRAEEIGRRWDSCHAERDDGRTAATLNMYLEEAGRRELFVPLRSAREDFDDDIPFCLDDSDDGSDFNGPEPASEIIEDVSEWETLGGGEFESSDRDRAAAMGLDVDADVYVGDGDMSRLHTLNNQYKMVRAGGAVKLFYQEHDPIMDRDQWLTLDTASFQTLFSNYKLQRDPDTVPRGGNPEIALGKAWLEWPERDTRMQIIFDPTKNDGGQRGGVLNMWTGWGVEEGDVGSWELLQELILKALCSGDQAQYDYILNWLAYMVQHPDRAGETALVFRGSQGTGKGTLGNAVTRMVGRHAMAIASSEMITGRFNAHLRDCLFLFGDEAINPTDHAATSRLKALITEPSLSFEGKHKDPTFGKNHLHIMLASNSDWVIPADNDSRRFFVADVNDSMRGNISFFTRLYAQLYGTNERGKVGTNPTGLRQMLTDLKRRDIPEGWTPQGTVPKSKSMLLQKIRSLSPIGNWIYSGLMDGKYPFPCWYEDGKWFAFNEHFRLEFHDQLAKAGIGRGMGRNNEQILFDDLAKMIPSITRRMRLKPSDMFNDIECAADGAAWGFALPSINQARDEFCQWLRESVDWPDLSGMSEDADDGSEFG